jgi:aldehyde dehydrogenase (NAD+)
MDFAAAVQRQRAFFQSGATRSLEFRREQLRKLHDALVTREAALVAALHSDLRKSPTEAYATEIGLLLSEIRHALRHLPSWMKSRRCHTPLLAWPARGFVAPEPYGVALILGPWNYPLQLLLTPLVGAMAAGNCAVIKPSEFAPRTAAVIAQFMGATFPEDYIAVVQGDQETGQALLGAKFDTIFFTGSTNVGRAVMMAAARHLTPVTLELGGKCPCLVCADAPTNTTARRIVWGKFMNAGQTCVAPDFVVADRGVRDRLVEAMKRALQEFYGDDPQKSPDYGRIINRKHFDRLTGYLSVGQIVHGGQHDAGDLYVAPTILTDVPAEAPMMQEEIFGPILPVLAFDRLEDVLGLLRDRPTPLASYLFSRNRKTQERVLAATRSGGVCINDTITHMVGKDLPFGGLGDSGLGAYHGRASFDCFTHRRSVLRRSFAFDPKLRYPPPRVTLCSGFCWAVKVDHTELCFSFATIKLRMSATKL